MVSVALHVKHLTVYSAGIEVLPGPGAYNSHATKAGFLSKENYVPSITMSAHTRSGFRHEAPPPNSYTLPDTLGQCMLHLWHPRTMYVTLVTPSDNVCYICDTLRQCMLHLWHPLKGYSSQWEVHSINVHMCTMLVVPCNCPQRSLINN